MMRLVALVVAAVAVALNQANVGVDAYLTKGPGPVPDPALEKQRVVHEFARVSRYDASTWGEHATFNEFALAATEPFIITDAKSINYPAAVGQWDDEYLVNAFPKDHKLQFLWSTTSSHMPVRSMDPRHKLMQNATDYFQSLLPSREHRRHFGASFKVYANPPSDLFSPWPAPGTSGHRGGWASYLSGRREMPEVLRTDVEELEELFIDDIPSVEELAKLGYAPQGGYKESSDMQFNARSPGVSAGIVMEVNHQVLAQVRGSARYRLFAPKQFWNLSPYGYDHAGYCQSEMALTRRDMKNWEKRYPHWAAVDAEWAGDVRAGEALYVPPHWWVHSVAGAPDVDPGIVQGDDDAAAAAKRAAVPPSTEHELSIVMRAVSVSRHMFARSSLQAVSVDSWVDPDKHTGNQINLQIQALLTMLATAMTPHVTDLPQPPAPNHAKMQTKWTASTLTRELVHRFASKLYPKQFDQLYIEIEDERLKPVCSRAADRKSLTPQQKERLQLERENMYVVSADVDFDLDEILTPPVKRMRDTMLRLPSEVRAWYLYELMQHSATTVIAAPIHMPHWLLHCLEWEYDFFDLEHNDDDEDGDPIKLPGADKDDDVENQPLSAVWKKKQAAAKAKAAGKKKKKKRKVRKVDSKEVREAKAKAKKEEEERKKKEEKEAAERKAAEAKAAKAAEKAAAEEAAAAAKAEKAAAEDAAAAEEVVDLTDDKEL